MAYHVLSEPRQQWDTPGRNSQSIGTWNPSGGGGGGGSGSGSSSQWQNDWQNVRESEGPGNASPGLNPNVRVIPRQSKISVLASFRCLARDRRRRGQHYVARPKAEEEDTWHRCTGLGRSHITNGRLYHIVQYFFLSKANHLFLSVALCSCLRVHDFQMAVYVTSHVYHIILMSIWFSK